MTTDVASRLRAAAPRLNERAALTMLTDPFWQERYGERARRFAFEDGAYHLRYCAEALAAGDPAVMETYARWLRSVLVPRGMCSEHLAENFRLLAAAVRDEIGPVGDAAIAVLERAEAALVYEAPPIRALQLALPGFGGGDDLRRLGSYLADALALGAPTTLAAHVAWASGFFQRHRPPGRLPALLAALHEACPPDRFGAEPRAYLAPLLQEATS